MVLLLALAFVLFLLWDAWQQDFGPKPGSTVTSPESSFDDTVSAPSDVPIAHSSVATDSKTTSLSTDPLTMMDSPLQRGQLIKVVTDVFEAEIDTVGGDLRRVYLRNYPVAYDKPDQPFQLMNETLPNIFIAQSGFTRKKDPKGEYLITAPDDHTVYVGSIKEYRMGPNDDTLSVDLRWTSPEGVRFIKRYTFRRGSYLIDVSFVVNNQADKEWRGNHYQRLQRTQPADGNESRFIYTYLGGVYYSPEEKYNKYSLDDMEDMDLSKDITNGWVAMIQHYFVGAWIPNKDKLFHYFTQSLDNGRYAIGMYSKTEQRVPTGGEQTLSSRLFVGPKLQDTMEKIAPGLELTVDYGVLTILAEPIYWLLEKIHSLVDNWGWSIILLTLLIKLAFYKLSETSYRSMAHMRRVMPRIQALKERHGNDRQKMSQAQMELFKREKINPLGGCLPILVQIPVFIALYWVLLESVELRQADWGFWIHDLSSQDPYYILPLVMGITMFFQQRLNPTPVDPIQAKVMMMLPIVFTVFFMFFPAGLVLYWVTNNMLSIAQQWYITRIVLAEKK